MISIIIATYNSGKFIKSCLDSIFSQDFKYYEVIVIDNNSGDNTKSILWNYPRIILIENLKNYGFSKAINQGINKAKNKYILCLNHDVELKEKFLINIKKAIETNPNIGAIQPKVIRPDNITIDTAGIYLSFLRRFYDIGSGQKDGDKFNRPCYIFGASAAAALYKKEALESIKQGNEYFDEDFFCIAEDVDISWRLQKKGWLTLYCPEISCFHHRGISKNINKYCRYLTFRNRYFMLIKNETWIGQLKLLIVFFLYDFWKNLFMLFTDYKYTLNTYKEISIFFKKLRVNATYKTRKFRQGGITSYRQF